MAFKNKTFFLFGISVLLLGILQEVYARRTILRGRKTITRYYMQEPMIPGYVVVILVALGELLLGGLMYVILRFTILEGSPKPQYRRAPSTPSVTAEEETQNEALASPSTSSPR